MIKLAKDLVAKDGYIMKMTFEYIDSIERTAEWDWVIRGKKFKDLDSLLNYPKVKKYPWESWVLNEDWIFSEEIYEEEDGRYNLGIERADGKPLSRDEVLYINKKLRIR
jgi:hypothetical protein